MNKMIAKTLIAGLACAAFCGTTLAARPDDCLRCAPAVRGGGKAPQKAPTHQTAPAPRGHPAPHGAPVAHHAPAPAPHHNVPPPAPHPGDHHGGNGWITLGAAVIGGVVGGIVGACH